MERPERTTERFDASVAAVARRQHGLIRRDQILALGASDGAIRVRVRTGRWERVHPSVFRIAGQPAVWRQMLLAASFSCGPDAVASHRAAAALWSMPGFPEGPIEISSSSQRGRRSATIRLHRTSVDRGDVTRRDRIPVTTAARTLLDLAASVPTALLGDAIDDAIRRRLVRVDRMRAQLERARRQGRRGVGALGRLLDARQGPSVPQSVLESKLLRLLRDAGLPDPVVQHRVHLDGRNAVIDVAYPQHRLAIEADGYRWHAGRARWEHDLARRNDLTVAGWRVIHVTWADVHDRPQRTAARIAAALDTTAGIAADLHTAARIAAALRDPQR